MDGKTFVRFFCVTKWLYNNNNFNFWP